MAGPKQPQQKTPQEGGAAATPAAAAPQEAKGKVEFSEAWAARVEEIMGRVGTRGDAILVRCRILDGPDSNKIIRRNVKGPVRPGDILMLRETEFEARKLTQSRR